MAGESQETPKSPPDPSVMATEQLDRALAGERDFTLAKIGIIEERLRSIDKATELLNDTVNRTPTDIEKEITHLREWMFVELKSVAKQFDERDVRTERESRDNTVKVDAAFAAQKDSAAKQDDSNQKAIDKSEKATADAILKLQDLFDSRTKAIDDKLSEVQRRQDRMESIKTGGTEARNALYALAGFLLVLVLLVGAVVAFRTTGTSP